MSLSIFDIVIRTTETGKLWTKKKLQALATELDKGIKTEANLNQFSRMLTKLTVKTALNAELTDHLGHEKNTPKTGTNTRNGCSSKTLLIDDGEIALNTPRDREGTFEPQLIKKDQTRITQMDSQILSLYAKDMTTREIVATFKEMYDADVLPTLISKVTDAVKEQVTEWRNRPLDSLYPIIYLDCIMVKVRYNGLVINKTVFLALGINTEGLKELLGMWLAENEGARFWLNVLTELKNRGFQDILIVCVDSLKGYPEAINSVIGDKKRKVFPTDDSVRKLIYLAIQSASKKWSMPIQNWRLTMSRFIIEFGDRLNGHI